MARGKARGMARGRAKGRAKGKVKREGQDEGRAKNVAEACRIQIKPPEIKINAMTAEMKKSTRRSLEKGLCSPYR